MKKNVVAAHLDLFGSCIFRKNNIVAEDVNNAVFEVDSMEITKLILKHL